MKLLNPDKSAVKEIYKTDNKKNITGKIIAKDVKIDENSKNLNTPIIIIYNKKKFKISGYNYVNQFLCTRKSSLFRKTIIKNKGQKLCNATIRGKRNEAKLNLFEFYLHNVHSKECIKFLNNFKNAPWYYYCYK